ncbi:uncharacterized protein VTP21DRAFT_10081 [Calcarisporiella thermophila]|uniref:uncharacterized protein n=1 Tax=Calcarisporiella thermophila TaxID=911321 RepID=UPI003742947A
MPGFPSLAQFYIALQVIAILLGIILLLILVQARTSLSLVGLTFTTIPLALVELITILPYGSNLNQISRYPVCIVQAYLEDYFHLSVTLWGFMVTFNLWLVLVRKSQKHESLRWPYFALVAWGLPFVFIGLMALLGHSLPNFGVFPAVYYCLVTDKLRNPVIMIPSFTIDIVATAFAIICTVTVIQQRLYLQKTFGEVASFPTSIKISILIRLVVFSLIYGLLGFLAHMTKLVNPTDSSESEHGRQASLEEFSGPMVIVGLFLVFGITRDTIHTLKEWVGRRCWSFNTRLKSFGGIADSRRILRRANGY